MALNDLTRREILLATEEYDRLGRDAFLNTYGFAPARSYLLLLNGRSYDSKAIAGVAHGYLPGRRPLKANNFSGGAATVGRLLRGLGFEVTTAPDNGPTDPSPSLTISALLDSMARLRPYRSPTGRPALYQPLTLVWAIGRAHRGLDRITPWTETENTLGAFLERHGEYPRPHYPLAALYHAGLWEIDGSRPVPPAHGNAPLRWFADHRPQSGLTAPFYNLVRYSGEARVATVEAIVAKYLTETDTDCDAILTDAGLADPEIADDQALADDETDITLSASPMEEEYRRLCAIADRMRERGAKLCQARVTFDLMRSQSARRAVLRRSGGHCENPGCAGDPQDITDAGLPILEIDHIQDLAKGGPDHPEQMIALCPNCHAIKTRGRTREKLRPDLLTVALQRHNALLARSP
jgi:5-methylcytosine-specific restriction protein A